MKIEMFSILHQVDQHATPIQRFFSLRYCFHSDHLTVESLDQIRLYRDGAEADVKELLGKAQVRK